MNLSGSVKINKCGMLLLTMCFILIFYYALFSGSNGDRHHKQYAYMMRNPNEVNLRKLLIGGIQAAQMGGIEVVAVSADIKASSKGKTKEGANDPVTNADLRSHCVMLHGLRRLFPRITIISEEDKTRNDCPDVSSFELDPTVLDESVQDTDDQLVSVDDVTVWIDPLDATQEYTGKCKVIPFCSQHVIDTFLFSSILCCQNLCFNMLPQWFVWPFAVNQQLASFTIHSHIKRYGRGRMRPCPILCAKYWPTVTH